MNIFQRLFHKQPTKADDAAREVKIGAHCAHQWVNWECQKCGKAVRAEDRAVMDQEVTRLHRLALANKGTPLFVIMTKLDLNLVMGVCVRNKMEGSEVSNLVYSNLERLMELGPDDMRLLDATKSGQLAAANGAIASGAKVNARDDRGWSPLHYAGGNGHRDLVEVLLTNGADINIRDNNGMTTMHLVVGKGNAEMAELLIGRGADLNAIDSTGISPLHFAAAHGDQAMVELLLHNRAEVNAKTKNGETPMRLARSQGHSTVIEVMRRHGGHD